MYYALVHYLENYPNEIDSFRKSYDPRCEVVKPHITFVFPIEADISEGDLIAHITKVLDGKKGFNFTLSGIKASWDDLVFLLVNEGRDEIIKLHDYLYTGLFKPFLRADIEFIPHVTLGKLQDNRVQTLKEAENLQINFTSKLKNLTLIKASNEMGPTIWRKEFTLKK